MTLIIENQTAESTKSGRAVRSVESHERWVDSAGVPVHKGYYIEDLRTFELGWWEERQCHAAFLQLAGQEGSARRA